MTTIYLVRHGQASFGAESYDKLSETGERQAEIVGRFFKETLKQAPFTVSGSMYRHQQTAQAALSRSGFSTDVQINGAWNEFDHQHVFAQYEPRFLQPELLKQDVAGESSPRAYLEKIFEGAIGRWVSGENDDDYHETWLTFKARVEGALQDLCRSVIDQKAKYAVVFTSGGVISVAVGKVMGLNAQQTFALNWAIANASVTTLRLVNGQLQLSSFNEYHYLKVQDADLLTWI